jgi:RNA polymerase sigma-70 factor (ECF subfamily)
VRDLRLVQSPVPAPTADEACLATFQQELDYIYRSLRHLGTSASEVDDLAQEVFLALRHCWPRYDATRPARPFLFGIAFRIAAAHQRKRRREVPFGIVEPDETGPSPDQTLHAKQARALVLAALERLPLPRRAVVVMHEMDDVPVAEVAAALGIPLFTAYSRLRKGRRELEQALRRLLGRKHAP